jgi:hypothetical protein
MGHRDRTYVIFDAGNDMWAYGYMKGWHVSEYVDFTFDDAHDLERLTDRAEDEAYIKGKLRERFRASRQAIVLVGASTRHLFKFVRWEMQVALELNVAIIAVNLNDRRSMDEESCPAILRDEYVVHVPFKAAIIRYALDQFPAEHANRGTERGPRSYPASIYSSLGL